MSSVTEVITFSDLYTDFINRTRGSGTQTATVTLAKRYINQSNIDVHVLPGNKFPWQFRRGWVGWLYGYRRACSCVAYETPMGGAIARIVTW